MIDNIILMFLPVELMLWTKPYQSTVAIIVLRSILSSLSECLWISGDLVLFLENVQRRMECAR